MKFDEIFSKEFFFIASSSHLHELVSIMMGLFYTLENFNLKKTLTNSS